MLDLRLSDTFLTDICILIIIIYIITVIKAQIIILIIFTILTNFIILKMIKIYDGNFLSNLMARLTQFDIIIIIRGI